VSSRLAFPATERVDAPAQIQQLRTLTVLN
jgi:hypothetical protein